jgi:predicted PurR-regulated permease PerM
MDKWEWGKLRDQAIVALVALVFLWVAFGLVERVLHIVVVVLLAIVLAYALEPPLALVERVLPRVVAALLIYALALGVIAAVVLIVGPPLVQQSEAAAVKIPGYLNQMSHLSIFRGVDIAGSLQGALQATAKSALSFAAAIAGGIVDAALVLVLGFWFMVDGKRMRDFFAQLAPARQRDKVRFVEETVSKVLGAYIRGQLTMAAIIGTSAGVGSWLLGVHYPVLIGFLAFLFELVPMVGPILGSLPAIFISLFQPLPLVLYVIAFFIVMQVIENNVLAPRITGHAVGLHPVAALLAIVIGADLGGIVGALFAVPLAGIASVLVSAAWKGWHGQPIVVERAGMRFRLPRRRKAVA